MLNSEREKGFNMFMCLLNVIDSTVSKTSSEPRAIYSGLKFYDQPEKPTRQNFQVKKRKHSPLKIVFLIGILSAIVVFYIWNKMAVNQLAVEINSFEKQYQSIISVNEVLQAEINQKSRLERIERIALQRLGLTYPKEQPLWFDVDKE